MLFSIYAFQNDKIIDLLDGVKSKKPSTPLISPPLMNVSLKNRKVISALDLQNQGTVTRESQVDLLASSRESDIFKIQKLKLTSYNKFKNILQQAR